MIGFLDASKSFVSQEGVQIVLHKTSFLIPEKARVGVLGKAGAGKTTIVKLLAGMDSLDCGHLLKGGSISWPLGFTGMFHPSLSADSNIRTLAALCQLDSDSLSVFCQSFAELGSEYFLPISTYSSGMKARLGFALSVAVSSDFYLADEVFAVGEEKFRMKCEVALEERLEKSGFIFFSRNPRLTQKMCDYHAVLINGQIVYCDSHDDAVRLFERSE